MCRVNLCTKYSEGVMTITSKKYNIYTGIKSWKKKVIKKKRNVKQINTSTKYE